MKDKKRGLVCQACLNGGGAGRWSLACRALKDKCTRCVTTGISPIPLAELLWK